jgi:TDG/mug DNA glycosylase family protein
MGTPAADEGAMLELVDKVPEKARIVFVGINPAIRSAEVGHYYAHPSNQFWNLLSKSGIAPRPVTAVDDDWLMTQGFGFTDVVKRPTVGVGDIAGHEYGQAPDRIQQIIDSIQPRVMAFVSKTAARAYLGVGPGETIAYGPSHAVGKTQIWFLPSTSGQSFRDSSLEQKLAEFRRLAAFLGGA